MYMVDDALFNEEATRKKVAGDQTHALVVDNHGRQRGTS